MTVQIPITTKYDGSGFAQAERDAKRAQAAAVSATRAQIAEHRKVMSLTAKLDRDLAGKGPSFQDQLKNAVGGQMLAVNALNTVVSGLKDFGVESLQAAAAADRLAKATDSMAIGFGSSGQAITASVQQASDYTINQMDAMQAANQAMLLGVAKTPGEFERLSKIAVALGRAMGQDATKSIEDLTIGMGRQSKLILDNLGLMVNAETANQKYAASIGKAASELTDAEKKQAFINEALAQGEKKMATLGDQTLDTAGKVERLSARWSDFQVEFGRAISGVGESGGILDALNAGLDRLISGAQAWQEVAKNIDLLTEAMDRLNRESDKKSGNEALRYWNSWLETLNPVQGAINEVTRVTTAYFTQSDALGKKMQEVASEQEALRKKQEEAARAAAEQAAAEAAAAAAMEESAKKAADLAKKLEAANAARRDVAGKLLDITENAAQETQKTWDEYYKKEAAAWAEHNSNIERIQREAAKRALEIQRNLARDLAKEDKDAARDIAKIRQDSARAISRRIQDDARTERQERRQRQIEARADQRLFDYDMRQLAAEGEFNQIQQAQERRAIEQQIAAEKQAADEQARQENSRVEIERMRQDAADQIAERQAQAEERKQELQQQAADELAANQERLAEELAQEEAAYAQKMADLRQWREEKLAEIEASKQESIQKLAEELAQNKDLTQSEMEALIPIAGQLGDDVGAAFAEGLSAGYARENQIDTMVSGMGSGASTPPTYHQPSSRPGAVNQGRQATSPPISLGFASGGEFTVGGAGGIDSQLVQFMATPGERVTITQPGQGATVNVNVNGVGGNELAAIIRRHVERGVQEYHDAVIAPWSNS